MAYMFMQGSVKRLLRSSAKMDDLSLKELLAQANRIDKVVEKEPVVTAV